MAKKDVNEKAPIGPKRTISGLSDLTPDPGNANRGTERGRNLLSRSMAELGAGRSILVDKNGVVIAGNKTLEQARKEGLEITVVETSGDKLVVVQRGDLDLANDVKARRLAYADNRVAEVDLEWNASQIEEDLSAMPELGELWSDEELEGLGVMAGMGDLGGGGEGGDGDKVTSVKETAVTRVGDLWLLDDHRLLCGDNTEEADVVRLMNGEQAAMMETDPTYGAVEFHRQGDLESVFLAARRHALREDAAWYVWGTGVDIATLKAMRECDVLVVQEIVWVKDAMESTSGDYGSRHESCLYGYRDGHKSRWFGAGGQTTVWEIGADTGSQKPIELFSRPMENSTVRHEVCYEPYGGAGSQLLGAEYCARKCYAIESEPRFVELAIRRWNEYTGHEARLDGSGQTLAELEAERTADDGKSKG